jgi:splicing factor U2AF subunit
MIIHHNSKNLKKNPMSKCKKHLSHHLFPLVISSEGGLSSLNNKLLVTGFPSSHTKDMIVKISEVFGLVKNVDLVKDPSTGEFKGQVYIEYGDEVDAKKGHSGMMGLKVGDGLLHVKRLQTLSSGTANIDGEMFKALLEDKPTQCLMLRNVFVKEEIEVREDYKELEDSVKEEMSRYGNCLKVHCPRAPLFGEAESVPGFGKVFVKFSTEEDAEKARSGVYRRRFNGRAVDTIYYPVEKFDDGKFD